MLSKALLAPFVFGVLIFLYLTWEVDPTYAIYIVPFAVGAAVVYMLNPQIDWWWYQRRPPDVQGPVRHLFETKLPFYQQLNAAEKTRFRNRVAMFMRGVEFMPQGWEGVPADVQAVIAASAVWLTFRQEEYLPGKYEHFVVYPHPFPSPQYPEKWHASELFDEDGVVLFSAEQLMAGFLQPDRFFNIGLYEFARVYLRRHPEAAMPDFTENDWGKLQRVSGLQRDFIYHFIGLPEVDVRAVAVAHFFVFEEKFREEMPGEYRALAGIFGGLKANGRV